jgi:hypothetical protein
MQASFDYTSQYARVEMRGKVREALMMPQTFARWGKAHLERYPAMNAWSARQWVGSFLQEITGIPWLVKELELDMLDMPRHSSQRIRVPGERTTDDPPMMMPLWLIALTRNDVQGSAVIHFITETLLPFSFDKLPPTHNVR